MQADDTPCDIPCEFYAIAGVRTLIRMVRAALEAPDAAVDIYQLAFHAGVAMEVLAELVSTPLFYHRCATLTLG